MRLDKTSGTFDLHGFCLLVQHVTYTSMLKGLELSTRGFTESLMCIGHARLKLTAIIQIPKLDSYTKGFQSWQKNRGLFIESVAELGFKQPKYRSHST